jgi:hypothetical protein
MRKLKHNKIEGLLREAGPILKRMKSRKPPKKVAAKLKQTVRRKFGQKTQNTDINTS